MKKKKQMKTVAYLFALFISSITFAACSSENEKEEDSQPVNVNNLQFSITAEDFGEDQDASSTRTENMVAMKDTINLNDEVSAEISIEKEPADKSALTRSGVLNGTYSICAYKTDGTRVPGVLKGTFSGGTFTADPVGSSLWVPSNDTYTFICYNSPLNDDGTNITLDTPSRDAMIGKTTVYVTGKKQEVPFTVKHACARVRFYVTGFTPNFSLSGNCEAPNNDVPVKTQFNVPSGSYPSYSTVATGGLPGAAQYINTYGSSASPVQIFTEWCYKSDYTQYVYMLPGTEFSKFRLSLTSGYAYGQSFSNIKQNLASSYQRTFDNGSYAIRITYRYNFKYLFTDGTTGTLKANPTKTPIGLVLKSNDGTPGSGLAMALTYSGYAYWTRAFSSEVNSQTYSWNPAGAFADMDGYKWTYDPTANQGPYGAGTQAHADLPNYYPPFSVAAKYSPSGITVTGANIGKWFLPSLGQWALFYKLFSSGQTIEIRPGVPRSGQGNIYFPLLYQSKLDRLDNEDFWSSTDGGYPSGSYGGGYYINFGSVNSTASLASQENLGNVNFIGSCIHTTTVERAYYRVIPFVNF